MRTPSPKYFCPHCRAAYEADMNYCGKCGADMHRASRLLHALATDEDSSSRMARPSSSADDLADSSDDSLPEPQRSRRQTDFRDPWLGQIIDNRYRVLEVIGRGGMGVVYKVEHQRMGKIAAMKVLHHDLADDREVIQRFHREAEAVSRLDHPNTVQVFDFGMSKGALYLVMEYVRGQDIGSLVDRDGAFEFARAAPLFGQIGAALIEAHELGVVHRDLKPENILVTRTHGGQDFVKVLDFGLAKISEREELAEVTGRGSIVGTPYYMSPEQIRGEDIDHRADIYSMGALMYRVLTSENCFTAKTPVGVLTKHLTEAVVPPSRRRPDLHLDDRIDDIVLKAMHKRPSERYASVRELVADIEELFAELVEESSSMRHRTARAPRTGQGPAHTPRNLADQVDYGIASDMRLRRSDLDRFERSLVRRRWLRVVMVPVLLAGMGVAGYYWVQLRNAGPHDAETEPNDDIDAATAIGAGMPVTGQLGKRISKTEPDRDFYRLIEAPAARGPALTLTAAATAPPNIDVDLYAYSTDGKLIARANEAGIGQPESIRRHRFARPVVFLVTEAKKIGVLPTENVSDLYTLSVTTAPVEPGRETEPNDSAADAGKLEIARPVTAFLDRRADVDLFRFEGVAGSYTLTLAGADELAIAWRVDAGEVRTDRRATLELRPGAVIRIERAAVIPPEQPLPAATEPYTIQVAR